MYLHPYKNPSNVDAYYVKLANKLLKEWRFSIIHKEFDEFIQQEISLILSAYFEDVVSYGGLWKGYTSLNKSILGKRLPFYTINEDDYYEDEINYEDVLHLIWILVQWEMKKAGRVINPENPGLADLAMRMYKILSEEFEQAPINEYMTEYLQHPDHYTDFFRFKELANWLCYHSYLLTFQTSMLLEDSISELEGKAYELNMDDSMLEYTLRSDALFNDNVGPLSLPVKEWFIAMLDNMETDMTDEVNRIRQIEKQEDRYFLIESIDDKYIHVRNLDNEPIEILKSSFNKLPDNTSDNKTLLTSLLKFDGEWHINGISIWSPESVYQDAKEEKEMTADTRKMAYDLFIKNNNGSPIAYFSGKEELSRFFNKIYVDGNIVGSFESDTIKKNANNFVAFASITADISIVANIANSIKDANNPFYNEFIAEKEAIQVLVGEGHSSPELLHYLLKNNMLPDTQINSLYGKERAKELIQDNLIFWVRFFQRKMGDFYFN